MICVKFWRIWRLIPGPKSPGQDIDVYLRPLMEELKALWVDGVDSYDSFKQESFKLHASLMWTINDFPAYAAISGWSTKGYKACPTCLDDNTSLGVINKISYFGHRRFLPKGHKWRRCKLFNGDTDTRNLPLVKSGEDILVEINDIDYEPFGKKRAQQMRKRKRKFVKSNWKKKSIMFELDYWSKLKLRHNLDVMHIEKNACDNLLGTLLNLKKKTKDTINARLDLQQWNIRKDLWIQEKDGRMIKPAASYTLSKDEAKAFCKFLKSIKFPDGYASNISRCADDESGRISGLKSHDCHVMIQRLLPIGIRGFMPDNISEVVVELGSFFKKLCARTLVVDDLEEMEKGIVLVLCKMEKIFPPAFFDVMVHLCVHLPREAMLGGPVASRWVYPIELYLGKLKNYVRNNAKPEGCIAEGYVADEALTFCSMYFSGKETIFNRQERNYDVDTDTVLRGSLSVFSMPIRNLEGHQRFRLSKKEINIAHWYVISNCIELESYLEEHAASAPIGMSDVELERWQQDNFSNWFKQRSIKCRRRRSQLERIT